jgi:glycolate oxidase FAD binding subunit
MAQVILPADEQELVECLTDSAERRRTLEIIGGGSRRGVGGLIEADAVLDVSRISGIVDYDPTELVLTARAGTTISEIESLLSDKQQMLAFEPPPMGVLTRNPQATPTLGGSVASNATGPRRIAAGAARDHFLGFRAVSGRGEVFKSGGRVVKNVTGFDLPKLLAGSWGSLAVLTEISVKVMPKPRYGTTLAVTGLNLGPACTAMAHSQTLPCSVSAAAYLPGSVAERSPLGSGTSLTLVRLEGFRESVDARARSVSKALEKFGDVTRLPDDLHATTWAAIAEVAGLLPADGTVWRLSVPAGQTERVSEALSSTQWLVDWGGGLIWYCNATPPESRQLAHLQCWRDGTVAESASAPQLPAAHRMLADSLKSKFDPFHILNPRRSQTDADAIH